jgi:serine protease Do
VFDGQVVRLDKIKDVADQFVRVRLTRIDGLDLSLFEFDYDLTMMIFFMDAKENMYARYGGRDAKSADARQSLEGLSYTMKSVLAMHEAKEKEFVPRTKDAPKSARAGGGGCMHCHHVRERLNDELKRQGKWTRDMFYRYPLPENVGIELDVQRGNIIKRVEEKSAARAVGLKAGDLVKRLGGMPIHSFGDVQFALDHAPSTGVIDIAWLRSDQRLSGKLDLAAGWRKSEVQWRPAVQWFIPTARISGDDLGAVERKQFGFSDKQLAFRQRDAIAKQARDAGILPGDIIFGVDDRKLEMDVNGFQHYVQRNYFAGDRVIVNLLRDGKRMDVPMTLFP